MISDSVENESSGRVDCARREHNLSASVNRALPDLDC